MQLPFKRLARVPVWLAGISVCLVTASGIASIYRSTPASYANAPDRIARIAPRETPSAAHSARDNAVPEPVASAPRAIDRRTRWNCPECGVVESTRQIEQPGAVEVTVRFRDGSTTSFNETHSRVWRTGERVMVIAGLNASNR